MKKMKKVIYKGNYPGDWVVGKKALMQGIKVNEPFLASQSEGLEPERQVQIKLIEGQLPWEYIPDGVGNSLRATFSDLGTLYPGPK